jgi:Glycosyl transferase family 2/Bifunctional DNA primase/polymerase, N-terminal
MPTLLELALAYTKAGISIIPISPDGVIGPNGSKNTPFDCGEFISRRIAGPDELRAWFPEGGQLGLAAVLGQVSGGLECLNLVYSAAVKLFRRLVAMQGGAALLSKLPATLASVEGTTRFYYRCRNPVSGHRWLAKFEAPSEPGVKVLQLLAFVHGEGHWTVLPGSPAGCGDLCATYEWIGADLTEVPTLSEDERELLLESASCLNAWVDPAAISAPASPNGFDTGMTWEKILFPLGWVKMKEFGEMAVWHSRERTKPGYCAVSGIGLDRELLYVIRTGKAYTKFGALASFHFSGDFRKAKSVRPRPVQPSRWETPRGRHYLRAVRNAQPLVSCIMPTTGNRRCFLPQAIRYLQRQTYPNLELVIVCDGDDDVCDLIPRDDERIRYFYLGLGRRNYGIKLNLGCERAKGDLMAHCDDDDWSHPDRLSFQVGALLAEGAEVCGFAQLLFLEIASALVWLNRTPALLHPSLYRGLPFGATYLYQRSYWSSSPFPDVRSGEDWSFTSADGRQDHSVLLSDYRLCVAMIHNSNTTDYSKKLSYWSPWPGDLREIMGKDLDFYRSLRES